MKEKEREGLPITPASQEEKARTWQIMRDYLREAVFRLEAVNEGEWCATTRTERIVFWVDDIHRMVENCVHIVSREFLSNPAPDLYYNPDAYQANHSDSSESAWWNPEEE